MTAQIARLANLRMWATSRHADDWLAGVGIFLIVLLLWLPFGFSIPFSWDGWAVVNAVDQGVVFLWGDARPLTYFPGVIADVLSPNPFVGANLFLIGLIVGKAFFCYLIFKRLLRSSVFAFSAAALVAVYPADTAIFHAALNLHFGIFFFVLAAYFLLVYWERPRWYVLLFMWFAELITCATYEAVYPLLILTPLLLVYLERRVTRRVIMTAVLWYAAPLVVLARLALTTIQGQGAIAYQQHLFTTVGIRELFTSSLRMYGILFGSSWIRGREMPIMLYGGMGIVAGVIGGGACWWLWRRQPHIPMKTLLILVIGGIVAVAAGYAPFALTSLRDSTDRTLAYSSLGAGLVLSIVFVGIAQALKYTRLVFAGLTAIFIGMGTIQVLDQHRIYDARGRVQEAGLLAITTQAPAVQPDTLVLVIDETDHTFANPYASLQPYFQLALQDMYENYRLSAAVCYPNEESPYGIFQETCHFDENGVVLTIENGARQQSWSLNQVVAFRYYPDGSLSLDENLVPYVTDATGYDPKALITFDAPLPPRVLAVLNDGAQSDQP